MPYAVATGGWLSLLALLAFGCIFCLSGHLIAAAFLLLPAGMAKTFPELGAHAAGATGRRLVLWMALAELGGGSLIALLIIWRQLELFLPAEGARAARRPAGRPCSPALCRAARAPRAGGTQAGPALHPTQGCGDWPPCTAPR